jgi:hypothetical protein
MADFFLSQGNTPFTIALAIMFFMTLMELISASLGMGISEMVDSVLPEFDADIDIDIDADLDADVQMTAPASGADGLIKLLSWFRVGEVPVIMLFIIFLTGFGLSGLIIQFTATRLIGTTIPTLLAAVPAILCAIPVVRICGGVLSKYMPKDETYVVSEKTFLGQVATVTTGTARKGAPAQAKLRDQHGQTHYILVVPDSDKEEFEQGEKCIIVSQNGSIFTVIASTSSALSD